jgi:hypothetical protein
VTALVPGAQPGFVACAWRVATGSDEAMAMSTMTIRVFILVTPQFDQQVRLSANISAASAARLDSSISTRARGPDPFASSLRLIW